MSELKYDRLLEAVKNQAQRNGITQEASRALNKVLKLSHPNRELAFLDWALHTDLYKKPTVSKSQMKLTHDQISI